MSARSPLSLVPFRHVWRSAGRSVALMLDELRHHTSYGAVVHVLRPDGGSFQVIKNGERYFVSSAEGGPLATVNTVLEAVMAGDAHLDAPPPEDDPSDFLPRGAA